MEIASSNQVPAVVASLVVLAALVSYLLRFGSLRRSAAVALAVCLLDQGSKAVLARYLVVRYGRIVYSPVIDGWLERAGLQIEYEENRALGFGYADFPLPLLLVTCACALALLVVGRRLARRGYRMSLPTELGCALVVGALGAVTLDRVRLGFGVDFLQLGRNPDFTYNLADLLAFAGLALLTLRSLQVLTGLVAGRVCRLAGGRGEAPPDATSWGRVDRRKQWLQVGGMVVAAAATLVCLWRYVYVTDEWALLPPLHRAALHGDAAAVARLLAKGAEANSRARYGLTPLMCAVQARDAEVTELLLAHGAEVDPAAERGATALGLAVVGDLEVAKLLLGHGAKLPEYALHHAVSSGKPEMVKLLLDHGASLQVKNTLGLTPLEWAKELGRDERILAMLAAAEAGRRGKSCAGRGSE